MTRQYVNCKFNPWDRRSYCYHFDLDSGAHQLKPGDVVIVETKDGEAPVTVESLVEKAPKFKTKPVLRRSDDQDS